MKKTMGLRIGIVFMLTLSACSVNSKTYEDDATKKNDTIAIDRDHGVEVKAAVKMDLHNKNILVIEVANDVQATLHYTYSTDGKDGVILGYYYEKGKKTTIALEAKKDYNYKNTWTQKTIELKKGVNAIYLSGEDNQSVLLDLKLENIEPKDILYTGLHLHV